jgi:Holliday junction DNA helicase RuvA
VLKIYDIDEISTSQHNINREESLSALEVLGYIRKNAEKVVDKIIKENSEATVEMIIKQAFKNL